MKFIAPLAMGVAFIGAVALGAALYVPAEQGAQAVWLSCAEYQPGRQP